MEHAHACIHEDDESFTLQIELRDDRAITLVYWKNGDEPGVAIWTGNGEHDFGSRPLEGEFGFREWAEIAVGMRPSPVYSAAQQTADVVKFRPCSSDDKPDGEPPRAA
jgi:hypothetical protein